jgi:hypothetical protein
MVRRVRPLRLFLLTAVLFIASACSNDGASSPTGPSVNGRSRGAVISGRVTGMSARATAADTSGMMATSRVTVTVAGTDISTVVDGNGEFTLTGVPPGDVQLRFAGNGVSASVTLSGVSATDRITVTISLNGNGARIDSERRNRGDDDDDDDDDEDDEDDDNEVKGAVSNLSGTCPALSFTVRATTSVRTNAATRFEDGPCTRIANGARVEVEGRRQADGSILATEVEIDD